MCFAWPSIVLIKVFGSLLISFSHTSVLCGLSFLVSLSAQQRYWARAIWEPSGSGPSSLCELRQSLESQLRFGLMAVEGGKWGRSRGRAIEHRSSPPRCGGCTICDAGRDPEMWACDTKCGLGEPRPGAKGLTCVRIEGAEQQHHFALSLLDLATAPSATRRRSSDVGVRHQTRPGRAAA